MRPCKYSSKEHNLIWIKSLNIFCLLDEFKVYNNLLCGRRYNRVCTPATVLKGLDSSYSIEGSGLHRQYWRVWTPTTVLKGLYSCYSIEGSEIQRLYCRVWTPVTVLKGRLQLQYWRVCTPATVLKGLDFSDSNEGSGLKRQYCRVWTPATLLKNLDSRVMAIDERCSLTQWRLRTI